MMAEEEGTFSVILDKVAFVKQIPCLVKATSDDETPTPGYLYQEICDLSFTSGSYCQTLLDYLVERLERNSYHVKLKVLRILHFLVQNGHPDFRQGLRRRARGIQASTKYSGPPDPLHGNTPYMMVRKAAQDLSQVLFDVAVDDSKVPHVESSSLKTNGGMGGSCAAGRMQGFGNTPNKPKTFGETIMTGLKEFADRVIDPHDPRWSETPAADPFRRGDYQPVSLTTGLGSQEASQPDWEVPVGRLLSHRPANSTAPTTTTGVMHHHPAPVEHRPGVAGGGWDDDDDVGERRRGGSGVGSSGSLGKVNGRWTPTGKESSTTLISQQSSADSSRGPSSEDVIEGVYNQDQVLSSRVDNVRLEDWKEEEQLVEEFVSKTQQMIPSRSAVSLFLKRCTECNSEMVTIFLNRHLQGTNEPQTFRALLLIDQLLKADCVSVEHITHTCAANLVHVFKTTQGSSKAKARKIVRQLQLLSGEIDLFAGMPPMTLPTQTAVPSTGDRRTQHHRDVVTDNTPAKNTDNNLQPTSTLTSSSEVLIGDGVVPMSMDRNRNPRVAEDVDNEINRNVYQATTAGLHGGPPHDAPEAHLTSNDKSVTQSVLESPSQVTLPLEATSWNTTLTNKTTVSQSVMETPSPVTRPLELSSGSQAGRRGRGRQEIPGLNRGLSADSSPEWPSLNCPFASSAAGLGVSGEAHNLSTATGREFGGS